MSDVLLMRLAGPMQSWGVQSRFSFRDTLKEPTKSGVIGLLCSALGRPRDQPVGDLSTLKMAVRVEQEGKLMRDFHTTQEVYRASGSGKENEISHRYFLADAIFLVALEGDPILLKSCQEALQKPKWSLYFGRKSFVPSVPLWLSDGLHHDSNCESVLHSYPIPWDLLSSSENRFRLMIEDPKGTLEQKDIPISFANRTFANRRIRIEWIAHSETKEESHVS